MTTDPAAYQCSKCWCYGLFSICSVLVVLVSHKASGPGLQTTPSHRCLPSLRWPCPPVSQQWSLGQTRAGLSVQVIKSHSGVKPAQRLNRERRDNFCQGTEGDHLGGGGIWARNWAGHSHFSSVEFRFIVLCVSRHQVRVGSYCGTGFRKGLVKGSRQCLDLNSRFSITDFNLFSF